MTKIAEMMLCCDGPLNGGYVGLAEALAQGYEPVQWPSGEWVWMQKEIVDQMPDTGGTIPDNLTRLAPHQKRPKRG